MTNTLLATKLHIPPTRATLVHRERLVEKLNEGLRRKLTLISAPAGFGKTTLLASYSASCGMAIAWLSLDKNDNQAGNFLIYLVAALQEADHTIGHEAAKLVATPQPAQQEAILTSLINDLETTGRELVLVLDDYQFIDNQTVHDAVAFFLDHCPKTFHILISSRSDPPLPLARMRARDQMIELRAADLRFTESEATQFLNEIMDLHLDVGFVTALEERTEGWAAGLQMAALSMRGREDKLGFIESFSGTNRYILDYLLEEVLAHQTPEIQHFLLFTSVLERLTAPLCDAILTVDEIPSRSDDKMPDLISLSDLQSRSILKYLERENLFLIPLDDERNWYRYHHLFADLLRARLHQAQPSLVSAFHIRASAWFEQNELIPEAIGHLFAGGALDQAADLIERYGPARWAEGELAVLQLADNLPHKMILARPKLGLHRAWLLIIRGQIEKVLPLLDDMEGILADKNLSEQQWMQTITSLALAFLSPPRKTPGPWPLPDYALVDAIPAEELILRNAADTLYVMTLVRRGKLDRAVEIAVECLQREKALPGTWAIPSLVPFLTRSYLMQGRLRAAASLCRETLESIKEGNSRFVNTIGSMQIDLGEVLCEWNSLEEAELYIQNGLHDNEPWRNILTDGFGLVALTRVLQAKGDYAGAMQAVEKFEARMVAHSRPHEFEEDYRTLKIRNQLASGDLQDPSQWANRILLNREFDLHKEYYLFTLARIRLAQGKYVEVEKLLSGTKPPAGVGSRITRQLEFNLLLAITKAGQGRLPEAFGLIETGLAMAEPEGYIRIFLDTGEPIRELLLAYLRLDDPDHKGFAQKIIDAFSSSGTTDLSGSQSVGLIEPLTERELEVLNLIALGKTNQEIAQQLIVARGTIKAHAASIYRKLDVANRTEAVSRARQLNIIP